MKEAMYEDSRSNSGGGESPSQWAYQREQEQRKADTLAEMEAQTGQPVTTV